jgi:hypothetical protein
MQLNDLKVQSFVTDLEVEKVKVNGGFLSIGHACSHENTCDRVCGNPHGTDRHHCGADYAEFNG